MTERKERQIEKHDQLREQDRLRKHEQEEVSSQADVFQDFFQWLDTSRT